jgi:Tol biopolymer transport system component
LVSPKDGRSWVITDPPNGSTGDVEARFTPDGKEIFFRRGGHGELFKLKLNGTTASVPVEVTHGNAGIRGLSVSRDGKTIYFGSQQGLDRFGIWRIREGETVPVRITPENIAAIAPAVDPRGHILTFAQLQVDQNLWLYDVQLRGEPRLLVPSTQAEYSPAFSPDGRRLAFISDRSGTPNIWISDLNGGEPRQLTSLREGEMPMWPAWSPDGSRITFYSRRKGVNYAYETDAASGTTRTLRSGDDYSLSPHYSADGKSLYFGSNIGHRFRIWRKSLVSDSDAEPLVAEDVRFFRTSKDGRILYFLQSNPERLIQLNLNTKEEKPLWNFTDSVAVFDAWDVAGNKLFYVSFAPTSFAPQVVSVDLRSGERKVLGTFRRLSQEWQSSIAASPDGQSVVVSQIDKDDTKLMLLPLDR